MTNTLYEYAVKLLIHKVKQIMEMLSNADIRQKTIDLNSSTFTDDARDGDKIYVEPPKPKSQPQPKKQVVKQQIIKEKDIIEFEDDYEEIVVKKPVRRKKVEAVKTKPIGRPKKQPVEKRKTTAVKRRDNKPINKQ
jgi:hypothetical protein